MTGHTFQEIVTEYENAMDRLHETAHDQSGQLDGLDAAMADLHDSVGDMQDAVGEYDAARAELTDAVENLRQNVPSVNGPSPDTGISRSSTAAD